MNKTYPFLDLKDATAPVRAELIEAVTRVIDSGTYVGGDECRSFEANLATLTGTDHCVGVSNGLDALQLILRAYMAMGRLSEGDEVIVPANTYIATVLAITNAGLTPVFAEPDASTFNLDWTAVEQLLTPRTKAVMTVHLYGRVAWHEAIAQRLVDKGLLIIEDNAQAIGAVTHSGRMTGSLGHAAAFSFYPTKNIGALGDAGAVTTNDARLAATVRALANYGSDRRYHNTLRGFNCRLDPLQAAVLNVKLRHLDDETRHRREIAAVYSGAIVNPAVTLPAPAGADMVWHQYTVTTDWRDSFTEWLDKNGVGWDIHYPVPPHLQPCYADRYGHLRLPVTERIARTIVSLPVSRTTSVADAVRIADIINRFEPPAQ